MKFKSKLALLKTLNLVMDKMKQTKFQAFTKIKEQYFQEISGENSPYISRVELKKGKNLGASGSDIQPQSCLTPRTAA